LLALPVSTVVRDLLERGWPLRRCLLLAALIGLTAIPDVTLAQFALDLSGTRATISGVWQAEAGPALLTLLPIVAVIGVTAMLASLSTSRSSESTLGALDVSVARTPSLSLATYIKDAPHQIAAHDIDPKSSTVGGTRSP
jgi:hypothetical protein